MSIIDYFKRKKYNADGYDADGYSRFGYDRQGYDHNGYDTNGFNQEGYNREGFDKNGLNKEGYNCEGFDKNGFDKEGYDREGFNQLGFDREGYNCEGFDKNGLDKEGYDHEGFDENGYDCDGYSRSGFNQEGHDREGFDKNGFDKEGYDREGLDKNGYDCDGYNRNGFNAKGYDRDGYSIIGFNSEGYDRKGFDQSGYDREGYNREGFDKNGFDKEGYDHEGFDENGHDRDGFDKNGFNKEGYDREGLDKNGYDCDGYNRNGFNAKGYDRDGYSIIGFNREGYDREGFNQLGFDRNGYNRDGYDVLGYDRGGFDCEGYDKDGFNKKGFDSSGYDREGFDKKGFNKEGYNREGYNRQGFDNNGYNKDGYNLEGLDHDGFNIYGYDPEGYDREGYDKDGFNRSEISKSGLKKSEFDKDGYHTVVGCDAFGYFRNGYNSYGINKSTGRDRYGFDANGIDENGFNIWGFNIDKKVDIKGNPIEKYENSSRITEDKCSRFENLYYQYIAGNSDAAVELSNCYVNGDGTVPDHRKALSILLDSAFEHSNLEAVKRLGRHFEKGDIVEVDEELGAFLNSKKTLKSTSKYDNEEILDFKVLENNKKALQKKKISHLSDHQCNSNEENSAFKKSKENKGALLDTEGTSWMDHDQLEDWREKKERVREKYNKSKGSGYASSIVRPSIVKPINLSSEDKRKAEENIIRFEIEEECAADSYLIKILRNTWQIEGVRDIKCKQKRIIEEKYESDIIVQACAGSGAARIMLYRLANMNYSQSDRDWSKVKIIAITSAYADFLKKLSGNLKIRDLKIITLEKYYLQILEKYSISHPSIGQNKTAQRFDEKVKLCEVINNEHNILNAVYSNEFRNKVDHIVWKSKESIKDYADAMALCDHKMNEILNSFRCSLPKQAVLYVKALFAYCSFGALTDHERMLCVTEGQNISELEYILLYNINGGKLHFNIYGDLSQKNTHDPGVLSWDFLKGKFNASFFKLNENYRNNSNINDFCVRTLGTKDSSLGIDGKEVEYFDKQDLASLLKIQILLGNKTVVIASSKNGIPCDALSLCQGEEVTFMTVDQAKGLEFNTAFVFDTDLTANEKYIAYTRALNELYVSARIAGLVETKALAIKKEKNVKKSNVKKKNMVMPIKDKEEKRKKDVGAGESGDENDKKEKKKKQTSKTRKKTIKPDKTIKKVEAKTPLQGSKDIVKEQNNSTEIADRKKYESITALKEKTNSNLLIVVRESWTNDFCFVVEKFDGVMARGYQYLNGSRYKASSYNRYNQEFYIYNGPSICLIEKDYVTKLNEVVEVEELPW